MRLCNDHKLTRLTRMIDPGAPLSDDHPAMNTPAIWHPDAPGDGPAWVLFRTTVSLAEPLSARFWISASQRFRCWLDGQLLATRAQPCRSRTMKIACWWMPAHWRPVIARSLSRSSTGANMPVRVRSVGQPS